MRGMTDTQEWKDSVRIGDILSFPEADVTLRIPKWTRSGEYDGYISPKGEPGKFRVTAILDDGFDLEKVSE